MNTDCWPNLIPCEPPYANVEQWSRRTFISYSLYTGSRWCMQITWNFPCNIHMLHHFHWAKYEHNRGNSWLCVSRDTLIVISIQWLKYKWKIPYLLLNWHNIGGQRDRVYLKKEGSIRLASIETGGQKDRDPISKSRKWGSKPRSIPIDSHIVSRPPLLCYPLLGCI